MFLKNPLTSRSTKPYAKLKTVSSMSLQLKNTENLLIYVTNASDLGNCQILTFINVEGTEVPQYFIRIGDFLQNLESSIWVMAKF